MDAGFTNRWSTGLMAMWASAYFSDGLMFEQIENDNARYCAAQVNLQTQPTPPNSLTSSSFLSLRILVSYILCCVGCALVCHLCGPSFEDGWDPSYRFYTSYKTLAAIGITWTLSKRVCTALLACTAFKELISTLALCDRLSYFFCG
jgi:hypothetical protein